MKELRIVSQVKVELTMQNTYAIAHMFLVVLVFSLPPSGRTDC